jgi:hypothetical protein
MPDLSQPGEWHNQLLQQQKRKKLEKKTLSGPQYAYGVERGDKQHNQETLCFLGMSPKKSRRIVL